MTDSATELIARALRQQALATVFAAAYAANYGSAPLSKAVDAVEHFKRSL